MSTEDHLLLAFKEPSKCRSYCMNDPEAPTLLLMLHANVVSSCQPFFTESLPLILFFMYVSFALSETEQKHHTTEREVLAALRCLEESRWLVQGAKYPTIMYTDHMAVKSVLKAKSESAGSVARWQYRLQEFDLEFVHIPGLSRVPHLRPAPESFDIPFPAFSGTDRNRRHQR